MGYKKRISDIKKVLRDNPRGLTINEISQKIGINRNTAAKYLDIMQITGCVELRKIGPAKIYFSSNRVPTNNLLNDAFEGVLVLNQKGKIIQANEALKKLLGSTQEDTGKPYYQTAMYSELRKLENRIQEAYKGKPYYGEMQANNNHLRIKIIPTSFEDGETGITIIFEDNTKEVQAQKEIENYFMLSVDLFSIEDFQGRFIKLNKAWERELGWSIEEMKKKHRDFFRHPDDQKAADAALESLRRGERLVKFTNRYRTRQGTYKTLEWSAHAVPEENRIYAVARVKN